MVPTLAGQEVGTRYGDLVVTLYLSGEITTEVAGKSLYKDLMQSCRNLRHVFFPPAASMVANALRKTQAFNPTWLLGCALPTSLQSLQLFETTSDNQREHHSVLFSIISSLPNLRVLSAALELLPTEAAARFTNTLSLLRLSGGAGLQSLTFGDGSVIQAK